MSLPEITPTGKVSGVNTDVISENYAANHPRNTVMKEIPKHDQPVLRTATTDVFRHAQTPALNTQPPVTTPVALKFMSNYPFAQNLNQTKLEFIDISDKIAAYFGEKEKDVKDSLSDTFKKLIIEPYLLMSKVDTSMDQKDHNREKPLKDNERRRKNKEEQQSKGIIKGIYYKLLQITGEILDFGRKIKSRIGRKFYRFKKYIIRKLLS